MPTAAEIDQIKQRFIQINGNLHIPYVDPPLQIKTIEISKTGLRQEGNRQTDIFLQAMQLEHVWTIPCNDVLPNKLSEGDRNEIDISDV